MKEEDVVYDWLIDLICSPPTVKIAQTSSSYLSDIIHPPTYHTTIKMADPQKHLQALTEEYQKLQTGTFSSRYQTIHSI